MADHELPGTMPRKPSVSIRRLILPMALFVVLGAPLLAYLWETANQLMSLTVSAARLGVALVAFFLFVLLLVGFARLLRQMEGGPTR